MPAPYQMMVYGLPRLTRKLQRTISGITPMLERSTKEAVTFVHSQMPDYPPEPATSTYQRTLQLWRSLTTFMGRAPNALSRVETLFGIVRGIVGTNLRYAPWVVDKDRQTRTHKKNKWWTLQDVVAKNRDGIERVYRKGLKKFLEGIF